MDAFSQILARLDAIKAMQSALAAEAADLAIAARVLKTFQSESPRSNLEGNRPVPREGTKADIIIGIMNSSPDPWTTGDKVREEFSRIKGVNVEIGSISPLLTKLKGEGKIVREGLKIALAARLEKTEAPDAVAQEAS